MLCRPLPIWVQLLPSAPKTQGMLSRYSWGQSLQQGGYRFIGLGTVMRIREYVFAFKSASCTKTCDINDL
jgi:hypothetical protein